jgi:hypothetical protein
VSSPGAHGLVGVQQAVADRHSGTDAVGGHPTAYRGGRSVEAGRVGGHPDPIEQHLGPVGCGPRPDCQHAAAFGAKPGSEPVAAADREVAHRDRRDRRAGRADREDPHEGPGGVQLCLSGARPGNRQILLDQQRVQPVGDQVWIRGRRDGHRVAGRRRGYCLAKRAVRIADSIVAVGGLGDGGGLRGHSKAGHHRDPECGDRCTSEPSPEIHTSERSEDPAVRLDPP